MDKKLPSIPNTCSCALFLLVGLYESLMTFFSAYLLSFVIQILIRNKHNNNAKVLSTTSSTFSLHGLLKGMRGDWDEGNLLSGSVLDLPFRTFLEIFSKRLLMRRVSIFPRVDSVPLFFNLRLVAENCRKIMDIISSVSFFLKVSA